MVFFLVLVSKYRALKKRCLIEQWQQEKEICNK